MTMQGPNVGGASAYDTFDAIAKASASGGGDNLKDGRYILAIREVVLQQGFKGKSFIVRFQVVHAEPQLGMFELGGQPVAAGTPGAIQVTPNAVGSTPSCAWVLDDSNPKAKQNVKQFMLALSNEREAEFDVREAATRQARIVAQAQGLPQDQWPVSEFARSCIFITSNEQPMRGALIGCTTYRTENRGQKNPANKGKLLVLQNWQHIPHVPADIQARRILLDKALPIPWSPAGAPAAG